MMMHNSLPNFQHYLDRHEQVLHQIIAQSDIPAGQLRQAMDYALFPGGKRLRPLLVYLMGELIKVPIDCLDAIAAAIELTHCYSLVHDDLPAMDNDDFRRGKPSCHRAFDEATAILVGDALQILAIEVLINRLANLLKPMQILSICQALITASGAAGMISGQCFDLTELSTTTVTEARLRTIHSLKTGRLFGACASMTLAATAVDAASAEAIITYIDHLGLVFQMQDDYLDQYAKHQHGKKRASDKANQKNTYASLLSQKQLQDLINKHYHLALDALSPFGHQAADLQALTQQLQQRI